jgi:methionine synthase II (cobalamin-independent)
VQISEPCLVYQPYREHIADRSELDFAFDAVRYVAEGNPDRFFVHTFFGDVSPVFEDLLALPVKGVGIDLYETELSRLRAETSKDIALGIVDSRESHVENAHWIIEIALQSRKHIKTPNTILAPNSDLKFLPRRIADLKVAALAKAASLLEAS